LQEICFKVANLFNDHLAKIETSDNSILKKVELIIRFHIKMMLQEYENIYISDHEWKHLAEPYLSNFKNQRKSYRSRLAQIIQQGIAARELNKIDPYVAVLTILSAIGGIETWQRSKKNVDEEGLEENMVSLLIQGIKHNANLN